jgi:TPP-dependent pyruvate/acetoin dehydrogenase alpha subunit
MGAHSSSDDPSRYRSNEEVAMWAKRDPVDRLRRYVAGRGLVTDASDEQLLAELTAEISAAIAEAERHPNAAREQIFDDVYRDLPWHLADQRAALLAAPAPKGH